jgi:hypothetical protein
LRWLWLVVVLALPILGWRACVWRDARRFQGEGVVAPEPPEQRNGQEAPFQHGEVFISPKARFSLRARVLGAQGYDGEADGELVPVDLALGWGALSEASVALGLKVSQGNRYYSWFAPADFPLGQRDVVRSSANMHIIPADAAVESALRRVRRGDVVELSGMLVDVSGGELPWHSSLTREDDGSYACEVVYTEALRIASP